MPPAFCRGIACAENAREKGLLAVSIQIKLPELLTDLKGVYKSIDVRTIAAELDCVTYNVVTSIQFSTAPQGVCKQDMRSRLREYGVLGIGPLKYGWACLPAGKWNELRDQLIAGELNVGDLKANLGAAVNLENYVSTISEHSDYIHNRSSSLMFQAARPTFPAESANTTLGRKLQYVWNDQDVQKQLSRSGFHSFRELAANYLGASDTDPSGPSLVTILAPIPVAVSHVEIDPAEGKIRAHVRRHRKLRSTLRLRGEILEGENWNRPKQNLAFGKIASGEGDQAFADAPFELTTLDDHVQLRLVHDRLGIISTPRFPVRRSVPPAYVNPIVEILKHFCPVDEFRSMCTEPKSPPKDSGKGKDMPQRLFEQYMQWLLSCFGFVALQLGAKEYLYEMDEQRGKKMVRGSLDLIAFHPQRRLLLLGSCKMSTPPDRDYNNLINVKAALTQSLRKEAKIDVALAIFTNADHCLSSAGYRGGNFVAVFDKPGISQLVTDISNGEEEGLFNLLTDVPDLMTT